MAKWDDSKEEVRAYLRRQVDHAVDNAIEMTTETVTETEMADDDGSVFAKWQTTGWYRLTLRWKELKSG